METENQDFLDRLKNPVIQALVTVAAIVFVMLGAKLVRLTGLIEVSDRFPWMTSASFLLCFSLFNSVFSVFTRSMVKYWGKSIYSFMGLAVVSGFLAYLFSSKDLSEAGSYWWIFIVVSVGYLVFLGIMAFIKGVVDFAQREEWNQPKIKSKKRQP